MRPRARHRVPERSIYSGEKGRTRGRGERNWATSWRSGTRGTKRRLGSTRKAEMESMIMVSESELGQGAEKEVSEGPDPNLCFPQP